ncbi:MAG: hypothetical protein HDS66_01525 [Bacteroidales bacterium]|nr:hypothetical protein [Bacteroidales bacterium]
MIKFDNISAYSDNPDMLVRKISTGSTGSSLTHGADTAPSHYTEISRRDYDLEMENLEIEEIYRSEVKRLIRERYSDSEEHAIRRKALSLLINPAQASERVEAGYPEPERVIEEFSAYDRYAEDCKAQARQEAPRILEQRRKALKFDKSYVIK